MLNSTQLKKIVAEARPLIEQQLDLTEQVAGLREVVTAAGGDWSQLKALVKAQIQDERDEASDGKRVRKILDKADYASSYADMLGLGSSNMNEKNSFAVDVGGIDPHLLNMLVQGSQTEAGRTIIFAALKAVQDGETDFEPSTGEIETQMSNASGQPGGVDPERKDDAASAGETADHSEVPAQDGSGTEQDKSKAAPVASVDAEVNDGPRHVREGANYVETAGETAPHSEPDAALRPQTGGLKTLVDQPAAPPPQALAGAAEAAGSDTARTRAAVTAERPDFTKPNPLCADPDDCGVYASWNMLCGQCKRRAEARQHEAGAVH